MTAGGRGRSRGVPTSLSFPRRRGFLQLLGVAGAVGIAGCNALSGGSPPESGGGDGPQSPSGTRSVRGRWIEGSTTDAESLLWLQVADGASIARVGTALDGAYAVTPDEDVFPLWMDVSTEDNRVYECRLRDGLRWSDPYGRMTADDWVYMIERVFQAPDNWAGFTDQGAWRRDGEFVPVAKTGELTFEVRLPEPDPVFPLRPILWGSFCLPKGLLEQYVPDEDVEGLQQDREIQTLAYAGNLGPYTFERWDREAEFVATRNPDYYLREATDVPEKWREAPYFERYVFTVIPEQSTRLSALQTGEVTSTAIPASKVPQFEGSDAIRVVRAPQPFNTLLIYNQRANGWPPFRRRAVRRALSWVVNKEAITDVINRGQAQVAHTFQPTWSAYYDDSAVVETGVGDAFDPERGRRLLADALPSEYGYEDDELIGPDGGQVTLRLVYPSGTETTETTAEFVAQSYGTVGIDVRLTAVQFNTLLTKYSQNRPREKGGADDADGPSWNSGPFNAGPRDVATSQEPWDLQYGITFNTYPRTPTATRGFWERRGDTNYFGYYPSADLSSLYDTAATAVDEATRRQALGELFGTLSADQPCNFVSFDVSTTGYQDEIAGLGTPEFGYGWDATTWYRVR